MDLVTGNFFIRNFFYVVIYIMKYMQWKSCCFMRCPKYNNFYFEKEMIIHFMLH